MTDIWIDPTELVATSDLLSQQVQRLQDAATGLTGVELPPGIAGRFAAELTDVTKETLVVGLAYVAEALDLRLRAGEVTTDQAQAAFTPGDWTAGMEQDASSTPASAFTPGDWTAGMDPGTSSTGALDWSGGVDHWTAGVTGAGAPAGLSAHGIGQLTALQQSMIELNANLSGTTEAPGGLSFSGGLYVDGAGNRGTLADAHPDPDRPGVYEL